MTTANDLTPSMLKTDEDIRRFVMGGNATFTVLNTSTCERRTFQVGCKRDKVEEGWGIKSPFFVRVMTGQCNENDYTYTGLVPSQAATGKFYNYREQTKRPLGSKAATGSKGFNWLWNVVNGRHQQGGISAFPQVEVWHDGRCACCGRKLTVPESIDRGIGPVCWDRING